MKIFYSLFLICFLAGCVCGREIPENTFKKLHSGIYKAMTFQDQSSLYDHLSSIFAKDELERHFNLFMKFQKKALHENFNVSIDDVEYREISISGNAVEANWIVRGKVQHKKHTHHRFLEYKAKYTIAEENQKWKILSSEIVEHADFELSEQEREQGAIQ